MPTNCLLWKLNIVAWYLARLIRFILIGIKYNYLKLLSGERFSWTILIGQMAWNGETWPSLLRHLRQTNWINLVLFLSTVREDLKNLVMVRRFVPEISRENGNGQRTNSEHGTTWTSFRSDTATDLTSFASDTAPVPRAWNPPQAARRPNIHVAAYAHSRWHQGRARPAGSALSDTRRHPQWDT